MSTTTSTRPVVAANRRAAVALHHTGTSEGAWDGPANEARLRNDEGAAYFRKAYAWGPDPEYDADTKQAWRFIHHEVSGEGEIGAANLVACSTAIGVLNGGRGGTTIPERDREGVWRHLAAHLRDGDREPPELKSLVAQVERRSYEVELRIADGDPGEGGPRLTGYAAVFGQPSQPISDGWGLSWIEQVARGAFTKTLREADVRALLNHNPDFVLGRTKAGTLALHEDMDGLQIEIQPPDTLWARDLLVSMGRGDINQMSFAFRVVKDRWTEEHEPTRLYREILEVQLFDVSVVTFPAYPQTTVSVTRDLLVAAGIDLEGLASTLLRQRAGVPLACQDSACLRSAGEALLQQIPPEPVDHHSGDQRKRQLRLIELLL